MDEYIDVATKDGALTGRRELKSIIHQKGLYHHTSHVWLYTKKKEILLAQRSAKKAICPLLWDVSVAGHIDAGETPKGAAVREIKEEIGLEIPKEQLKLIGVFNCFQNYDNGLIDNEFHNTFIAELKVDISELSPQKNEVEALKLVTFNEFETLLNNIGKDNHFVASNKKYYHVVYQKIVDTLS
ncbi:NUDIX hydrolase [Jejuia pallidilutea]|uniref:Putative Nudix hydrolase YfcD n=1 Tax=Jejuia pallidilutea TaxID=504487 RepID=A0A090WC90_9FLAO|nr:NUDIX domain-containing protein [Jejuia pallidilutea]GAL68968.1 putative Nudix hydrolase YfcD [Jejuia pallidilutea]GAL73029.1 putative nudix hydrolase YfcD [Jejuia pallidilutea]GAL89626.1 putative Nudix hydrolase YfcD [Jejuia pallidilutea]